MENEATRQGADVKTETEERTKTARELAMDGIEERHDEYVDGQIQSQNPEAEETTDDEKAVLVDEPARYKVRVKLGDREEERGLDSVVNELQTLQGRVRSMSGRETSLQAELQKLQERSQQLEQQLTAQVQAAVDEGTTDLSDEDVEARVAEVTRALEDGDEEKVAEFFKDVYKGRQQQPTQTLDEDKIKSKVKTELKSELDKERLTEENAKIWNEFVEDNTDFQEQKDPETGETVVSEKRQYGDFVFARDYQDKVVKGEISYREALDETAKAVSKVFDKPEPEEKKTELEKRQERKQELDQLPVAASVVARGAEETGEEKPAEIIAEMRKARGLPA